MSDDTDLRPYYNLSALGIPRQLTLDKGTETHAVYARQTALREQFGPQTDDEAAVKYIKSTRNIVVERSWNHFVKREGLNIKLFWKKGIDSGYIHSNDFHQ
jgi:hypothetical protein